MRKQLVPGLMALGLVAVAMASWAGEGTDAGKGHAPGPVSLAEVKARGADRAQQMDGNHDGVISAQEMLAYQDAQRLVRAKARLARFDTNNDGQVSVIEMADAHADRLAKLDTNNDGTVTAEEFRAGWQGRGFRHRHHGEHGPGEPAPQAQ